MAKQWIGTDGQVQRCHGQLVRAELQFCGHTLHQFLEQGRFLGVAAFVRGSGTELFAQAIQASLVDRGVAGNLHRLDGLAGGTFEIADEAALAWGHEQHGFAGATRSAGATDPVHIGLTVERHVVVDHQTDPFHVEATGGHIGCHRDVDAAASQAFNGAFALVLRNITIENGDLMPAGFHVSATVRVMALVRAKMITPSPPQASRTR